MHKVRCALGLALLLLSPALVGRTRVSRGPALIADFQQRVAAYLKLRNQAESGLQPLKPADTPEVITEHEHQLADKIRSLRTNAKQGDIFTPAITAEFRRLMKIAFKGPDGHRLRRSLASSEPVALPVRVNEAYPPSVPLQSMPESLVANLPSLPEHLEYRLIGRDLILRDTGANLIVDFAPDVIR